MSFRGFSLRVAMPCDASDDPKKQEQTESCSKSLQAFEIVLACDFKISVDFAFLTIN